MPIGDSSDLSGVIAAYYGTIMMESMQRHIDQHIMYSLGMADRPKWVSEVEKDWKL